MTIRQLSVFVENKTGRINDVARILGANGINMEAFSLAESADFGILRMVVSDVDLAQKVLKEAHFGVSTTDVICLKSPSVPGALSDILEHLAAENVFIEYMYAFSQGDTANVVIRPTDVEKGVEVLSKLNYDFISINNLIK